MRALTALVPLLLLATVGCTKPTAATTPPTATATAPSTAPVEPRGAEPSATDPATAEPPTIVFLVRHAEKASDGTRNPPLLPEGQARATCLARVLADVPVTHTFATDLQRTALTLAPLAEAHGLTTEITAAADGQALLAKLGALPPGSIAVVAGHSNTIPQLSAAMAGPLAGLDDKGNIPETEHDRMVELVLTGALPPQLFELRYCPA